MCVQDNWYRGDVPPGVDPAWIKKLWVIPTSKGVATKTASLLAFENCLGQIRRRLDSLGYVGKILATTDAPDVHGIKWCEDGTVEISDEMTVLLQKYDVLLCPLPHNTSTAIQALDQTYFRELKRMLRLIFAALPEIKSHPTRYLNPATLRVEKLEELSKEQIAAGAKHPSRSTRSCHLEPKLTMRSVLWAFAIIHKFHLPVLARVSIAGFREIGECRDGGGGGSMVLVLACVPHARFGIHSCMSRVCMSRVCMSFSVCLLHMGENRGGGGGGRVG